MNTPETFNVKNEQDFQELMESVDENLRQKGVLIFQRPLHAWGEISSRFRLNLIMPTPEREPIEGCYTGYDLSIRIFRWFDERYGDKLLWDPTWKTAIILRGDAYKMRIPLAYGASKVISSIEEFGKSTPTAPNGELPTLNVLDLVDGLTENYVKTLKPQELKNIFDHFMLGNDARNEMEILLDITLIEQAKGDIDAAVSHIFSNPPQYGLSKWSSLQATEKIIKAYIQEKNNNFPFSHDLNKLAKEAQNLQLREIPESLLDVIQCSASVRYGNPPVNLVEAVQAHHACLDICLGVAKQIFFSRQEGKVQLVPNKYYVNGVGHYTRCISVDGDKARMMLFTEVNGGNLEVEYIVDKKGWHEYVGLDIFAITQPLEERYQTILRNKAKARDEAIRKLVPFKD